jgi:PBP1b-binding outer membrane lipoprotein LpoB
MKTKLSAAAVAAAALLLSGCASQMVSDLDKAFDNPTRIASNDRTEITQEPYLAPATAMSHPPAAYPNPYAANIGPSLK